MARKKETPRVRITAHVLHKTDQIIRGKAKAAGTIGKVLDAKFKK